MQANAFLRRRLSLKPELTAERFADARPGFALVSFGEVGLPVYRLRLRAQVLERKPLLPIEETVMMAIAASIDESETVRNLLGLDKELFDVVLAELLRKEHIWLTGEDKDRLGLTEGGKRALEEAREIVPVDLGLEVHFDAMLRKVIPFAGGLVESRRLESAGLREVPPSVPRPPELADLDQGDVERVSMRYPGSVGAMADLLALKRIDWRTRVFRAATILVYRSDDGKETEVAFVLDDQLSPEHESAFSRKRLARLTGIRAATMLHPSALFRVAFGREETDLPAEGKKLPPSAYAGIRLVEPHKQPANLHSALTESTRRLLIVSDRVTSATVDQEFLAELRRLLVDGIEVYVGVGPEPIKPSARAQHQHALRPLDEMFYSYRNLHLKRFAEVRASILISDSQFAIVSRFQCLGFRKDPDRIFGDERGLMIGSQQLIDELFERQTRRFS